MVESKKETKRLKCGLVMSISATDQYTAEHWAEVKQIIIESLANTLFDVELVSHADEVGVIHGRIVNNLYNSDIIICDVSGKNPNVMFELGMRLAFNKPIVIIKDKITNYSFDTAPIEHIDYPATLHYPTIVKFKDNLKAKVIATYEKSEASNQKTFLDHFGEFHVSRIEQREVSSAEFLDKKLEMVLQGMNVLANKVNSISNRIEKSDYPVPFPSSNERLFGLGGRPSEGLMFGGGISSAKGIAAARAKAPEPVFGLASVREEDDI